MAAPRATTPNAAMRQLMTPRPNAIPLHNSSITVPAIQDGTPADVSQVASVPAAGPV
jgi:hypothetical protein